MTCDPCLACLGLVRPGPAWRVTGSGQGEEDDVMFSFLSFAEQPCDVTHGGAVG